MDSITEIDNLGIHTDAWFDACLKDSPASESAKRAAVRVCRAYAIRGQSDPGYIANVIFAEETKFRGGL
jgi:hypothetical protein